MNTEIDDDLLSRARVLSSATLHEAAGRIGALPSALKPLCPELCVCGRALPVLSPGGDNLWLHRAIENAMPSDVLVINTGGATEFGYWGEIMALAAMQKGVAGLVIDGGVRDSQKIIAMKFPVFSASICIQGTGKTPDGVGSLRAPISGSCAG